MTKSCLLWIALFAGVIALASVSQDLRHQNQLGADRFWSCPPYCKMTDRQVRFVFETTLPESYRGVAPRIANKLVEIATRNGFDPAFILSVIQVESGFNPQALSPRGAVGLMQLMPDTAHYIAGRRGIRYSGMASLSDPVRNIELGVAYLDYLRTYYRGDFEKMIVAYNMGPGRLDQYIRTFGFKMVQSRPYVDGVRAGVKYWRTYGLEETTPQNALSDFRLWLKSKGV